MDQTDRRLRIDHWIVAILLFAMAAIAFLMRLYFKRKEWMG